MPKKKFDRKPVSVLVTGVYPVNYEIDGERILGCKISYAEFNAEHDMVGAHLDKCTADFAHDAEFLIGEERNGCFAFDRNGRITCFCESEDDEDES